MAKTCYFALLLGHTDIVKYLVTIGANVNEKTNRGVSLLELAVRLNNVELVNYFLNKKVDVNNKTCDDLNVLDFVHHNKNE